MNKLSWGIKLGRFFAASKTFFLIGGLAAITVSASLCTKRISTGGAAKALVGEREQELRQRDKVEESQRESTEYIFQLSEEIRNDWKQRDKDFEAFQLEILQKIAEIKNEGESVPCPPGCIMPNIDE